MDNIVVFLNGSRGLAVLDSLLRAGHDVSGVVTLPSFNSNLLQGFTAMNRFQHFEIMNVNDAGSAKRIKELKPSLLLIAGFPTIFGSVLLETARMGAISLHAGRLPEYRGGSPLNWQLINGESEAGVSIVRVDTRIDTGPVLAEAKIPIHRETTIADLHYEANRLFPQIALEAIGRIENGDRGREQSDSEANYWHQRNDDDGQIVFREMTSIQIDRMVRGLTKPYPGAWCQYQGRKVRVWRVEIPNIAIKGVPGRVIFLQGKGPYVVCRDRGILLAEIEFESRSQQGLHHGTFLR